MQEMIGKTILDYTWYPGEDLYSDGAVEDRLLTIAMEYEEDQLNQVIAAEKSWPVIYHFSHIRKNILEWLPITKDDKVLEIGSGCGAITGALAEKAGSVRCIDLSKKRSYVNAYRNMAYDNISIDVGNFADIESHLTEQFDYITLIGVYEYANSYLPGDQPYIDFLQEIKKHLKPGGTIVLAIENRLGLKYWAGCREDHNGMLFEGIEGYHNAGGARTFSKPELTSLFEAAGFASYDFYYPYPDYKFPMTIYSDERLPVRGELNQNIVNFDRERLQVFDETKVYDGLLESGLFPDFSNSFLVLLQEEKKEKGEEEKLLYSRYSNERDPRFSIRTDIVRDKNGEKKVRKSPWIQQGQGHIAGLCLLSQKLEAFYKDSPIHVVSCHQHGGVGEMNFIAGSTLEEKVDLLLEKGREKEARELFLSYLLAIKETGSRESFQMTDEFSEVFGQVSLPEGLVSLPLTDIDMVLGNILLCEGWQLIDCEWTFAFPIPLNYLLYRVIHYYVETSVVRSKGKEWDLYREMGISQEEIDAYEKMELHFQSYIKGSHVPVRDLYDAISPGMMNVYSLALEERRRLDRERLQVFASGEEAFTQESSVYYPMEKGCFDGVIPIPEGVKKLRLDPCSFSGYLTIEKMEFLGGEASNAGFMTNGLVLSPSRLLFATEDPQLLFMNIPKGSTAIRAVLTMEAMSEKAAVMIRDQLAAMKAEMEEKEDLIASMEATKVWRAYKKYRKIRGKDS